MVALREDLWLAAALLAGLAVAWPGPAAAEDAAAGQLAATGQVGASPADVLFSDDFSFADAGWSLYDAEIREGALLHSPKPSAWSNAFYFGSLFHDADVRVRARIVASSDKAATAASLAFWHLDGQNFYAFTFWPESAFLRVTRFQDGSSIAVVERKVEGFAPGPDGSFELGVATRAGIAAVSINGREIARFKGRAPPNGWKIGTFASAPKEGSAQVAFEDLRVLSP